MKIKIPGDCPIAIYPAGGRSIYVPGEGGAVEVFQSGVSYLLRDEFTTPLAAGSVNGTNAEPGPGVRTVVDVGSKLSLSGGNLVSNGGPGSGIYVDPRLVYGAITRVSGRMCVFSLNTSSGYSLAGFFDSVGTNFPPGSFLRRDGAGTLSFGLSSTSEPTIGLAINYSKYAILLREYGGVLFGYNATSWCYLYSKNTGNNATEIPGFVNYDVLSTSDFIRIPTALWLPTPLLSDGFGGTWPTTDGLGHAEGIAGGIGSGGGGLTWTDAGNASIAGGVLTITPSLGVEKVTDPGLEDWASATDLTSWAEGIAGTSTITRDNTNQRSGSFCVAGFVDGSGSTCNILQTMTIPAHVWCGFGYYSKSSDANCNWRIDFVDKAIAKVATASYAQNYGTTRTLTANPSMMILRHSAVNTTIYIDDVSVKPLPISTLITNQSLITTDVLAEEVISARTVGTQVGMVQADRSFAAKAAATAASGQAVLSLKEVTGVGGVGLAITDGITVNGTVYTIASVTGGANVAYDNVAKTQTITLGANLGTEVLADAKVGLDWASWNGVLCYFDGAGNVKVDEIKAGVYTNRGSTAVTFVADKRLIVRKIGTEYRWFYNEVLVTTTTAVDAASITGLYWGMFSTLAANTITSFVVYDTGNVTNLYSNLDRYSN
jgi:hypothetical protein